MGNRSIFIPLMLLATCLSVPSGCSVESGATEASAQSESNDDARAQAATTEVATDSGSSLVENTEKNAEQLEAVLALEGDPEYGAYLSGDCLTCHVPEETNGKIPQIHGKDKTFLASALLEYKNKQRPSEVMRGVAAALSNEEMAALIMFLSEQ